MNRKITLISMSKKNAKGISQKLDVAKSRLTSKGQKKSKELRDVTKDLHQRLLLEFETEDSLIFSFNWRF